MPASTLPSSTWVSTDLTSACRVTGLTAIPAFLNTFAAVVPHGTCGWHSATLTDGFDRLSTELTLAGLPGGTATSILFLAKSDGLDASPALTTWSMLAGAAEAKTLAGAPLVIWVARPELGPKLKVTVSPGWAASNCLPIWVNEPCSDAAAKTVIEPAPAVPVADAAALAAFVPVLAALDVAELAEGLLDPQPARVPAAAPAVMMLVTTVNRRNATSVVARSNRETT